jgi:hypothetical protein
MNTSETQGVGEVHKKPTNKKKIGNEALAENFKLLKTKLKDKIDENKMLKSQLRQLMDATNDIEKNFESIKNLYNQLTETMSSKKPLPNQDCSTCDSGITLKHQRAYEYSISANTISINLNRKHDELEHHFKEMSKNFNLLVVKYKLLDEERNRSEENKNIFKNRCMQLESQYDNTLKDLYQRYEEIKRYKEIDKCLINYTLNSFMLVDNKDKDENKKSGNVEGPPGIKCEPIPTFAKFLAKKKY